MWGITITDNSLCTTRDAFTFSAALLYDQVPQIIQGKCEKKLCANWDPCTVNEEECLTPEALHTIWPADTTNTLQSIKNKVPFRTALLISVRNSQNSVNFLGVRTEREVVFIPSFPHTVKCKFPLQSYSYHLPAYTADTPPTAKPSWQPEQC